MNYYGTQWSFPIKSTDFLDPIVLSLITCMMIVAKLATESTA